jgi:hypothetical protein
MVKIARCNVVYSHNGNGFGIGFGKTPKQAENAARQMAYTVADAAGSAWIDLEVKDAVCPEGCPGDPDYVLIRRGNAKTLGTFPFAIVGGRPVVWISCAQQGWRAEYWCGTRPVESKEGRRQLRK